MDREFEELNYLWGKLSNADRKAIRGVVWMERRKVMLAALWIAVVLLLFAVSRDPLAIAAGIALGIGGAILLLLSLFRR
jgi:hypothetical protein